MDLSQKLLAKDAESGITLYMIVQQWQRVTKKIERGYDCNDFKTPDDKSDYIRYYKEEQSRLNYALLNILQKGFEDSVKV